MNQEELVECMRELAFSNPFVELDESRDWNQIIEETFSKRPSLQDDLYMQLRTSGYAYDKNLCAYIIESLDSHGFFLEDQETATRVLDCSGEALKRALRCVQSLEPAGVAATSRNECVVLQLRKRTRISRPGFSRCIPRRWRKKIWRASPKRKMFRRTVSTRLSGRFNLVRSIHVRPTRQRRLPISVRILRSKWRMNKLKSCLEPRVLCELTIKSAF